MLIIAGFLFGYLPVAAFIALLPFPLAIFALTGAVRHGRDIGNHPQYLAANVAMAVCVPLLLAIALLV